MVYKIVLMVFFCRNMMDDVLISNCESASLDRRQDESQ